MFAAVAIVSNNIIADEATRSSQHLLHGTINEIERPLSEVEIVAHTVAAHVVMMKDERDYMGATRNVVSMDTLICGSAVIIPTNTGVNAYYSYMTEDGEVRTSAIKCLLTDSSWVSQCVALSKAICKPFWVPPYQADGERNLRVTCYCQPIFRYDSITMSDSVLLAIVTTELPVDWMEKKVESLRPYTNSLTTISCGENNIIGLKDTALIAQIRKSIAEDKNLQSLVEDMKQGKDSIRRRIGNGKQLSFVVYGPLHNGWIVSIICQYRDVLARAVQMHISLLIIGLIGLVILFFVCRRIIRSISKPITQLSESALNMAKGDFKAELPEIQSQDEMKNLRDSFVFMQNSIADYIEELKATTAANERMESELGVARNIQMGMLRTDFPQQLYAILNPAKEVGGDLYDYVVKNRYLYFSVGDVSGKGVPASLMMAITRAALRFVSGLDLPMNETMSRINGSVCDINSNNMFVTLFVGRIDTTTGNMDYCNAGHNPIIIMPPDGEPYFLKAKANLAVGLFDDFPYESQSIHLDAGTRIVAYTDGVNEAENADKSLFGNDRLMAWAKKTAENSKGASEKEVAESLYNAVKDFAGDNPQNDDITIMSIKI